MEDRIKRISEMEHRYEKLELLYQESDKTLKNIENNLLELQKLTQYYTDEWMDDYNADDNGELPQDLKRGILSEDLIYNQLIEYHELALRLIKTGTKILEIRLNGQNSG